MVVGLGNPGSELAGTRHNVGAEVAALLVKRQRGRLRAEKGLHALACRVSIDGRSVLVAVPQTYMNESGLAVRPLVRRSGLEHSDQGGDSPLGARLIVVHDELDLPSGRVKLKAGGGSAGHNGLKSIERHLHTRDYLRVRIGIGKPPGRQPGADYVLERPGSAERAELAVALEEAADAVETIVSKGAREAMNRVNASS
ncbi:MAG: aminoacyl-tRNA hydrolase [Acidimicrobiales bacterium]